VTRYVLDASVAAKWYLPPNEETLVPEALYVLREYSEGRVHLMAPDIFWSEIGNILWKAARSNRISTGTAEKAVAELIQQRIVTLSSYPLLADAFAIAVQHNRTVYDAMYVALAVASGAVMLTADERLANSVASYLPILWLGAL
jgi:predicted nucleic acid-binding protein